MWRETPLYPSVYKITKYVVVASYFSSINVESCLPHVVSVHPEIHTNFLICHFRMQETSKWVEVSLQSIQTQIVPGNVIATPQQLQEFHQALIG